MPSKDSFKSFYLDSHTSGGMAGYTLIWSSNICTSYLNLILASVFFDSLIARLSFTTFSAGGSSSRTFTYGTVLQVSMMTFSNCCYHCHTSSLCLAHYSNSFFIVAFSFFACIVNFEVLCSLCCSCVVKIWWKSCNTWMGSATIFMLTLCHALTHSLSFSALNCSAPTGTYKILMSNCVSILCSTYSD